MQHYTDYLNGSICEESYDCNSCGEYSYEFSYGYVRYLVLGHESSSYPSELVKQLKLGYTPVVSKWESDGF